MLDENLFFTINDELGNEVECRILSLLSNKDYSYVVFTDGELDDDSNIIFKYGRFNKLDNEFELQINLNDDELDFIKDHFYNDLLELSEKIIKENG